jgi:predicted O-methyltransferase YrrM
MPVILPNRPGGHLPEQALSPQSRPARTGPAEGVEAIVRRAFALGMLQVEQEVQAFAAALRERVRPLKHFMEIGTDQGGTFHLMSSLADAGGRGISVDMPGGNWGTIDSARNLELAGRLERDCGAVCIRADSHDPATLGRVREVGGKLDLLFIDGDHSYQGVRQDYLDYSPLVRPGGWVVFHDVNDTDFHRAQGCDVARFWNELPGPKLTISAGEKWGGIGVIER